MKDHEVRSDLPADLSPSDPTRARLAAVHGDPPRVLVVDDDRGIAGALELALRSEGYDVRIEGDALHGEAAARAFLPHLAVLDLRLPPGDDGVCLARRLRDAGDLPIIFLTAVDDLDTRVACFDAGADDYMAKPFSMAELLLRIRALLRRAGQLSSGVHRLGPLVIDERAHRVVSDDAEVELTPTEFRLLLSLVRSAGQVLSKRQLLEEVWGFDEYDTNLVEVHVSSLRRKLEAHGPRLVHTVRGVGYVVRA